jgi:dihydrofolate reductase
MRNIVAGMLMSLDGVVESPNDWGWSRYMNEEMSRGIMYGISQADAVLLGRRTYEEFARLWPSQASDVPMSDFLNKSPKYVVSSSSRIPLDWQPADLVTGNVAEQLKALKQQEGKNIQVPGSPTLVRWLLREGLLDSLSLSIAPIVVGKGMRLFDAIGKEVVLKVVHSTVLSNGVIGATYQPASRDGREREPAMTFPDAAVRR